MSYIKNVNINKNALGVDAWGRNKTITDKPLFSGLFQFNVNPDMWIIEENGIENIAGSIHASSRSGRLVLSSSDNKTYMRSRRNPRYQPNRGHIYSSSVFLPSPTRNGERNFGLFTSEAGAFFRLKADGKLYAVIRTRLDDSYLLTESGNFLTKENGEFIIQQEGNIIEKETEIPLPSGIDLQNGNIYDIQMQWRGVGNIKFFINLEEVFIYEFLGTLTELSIFNPAMPIGFESINLGDEVNLQCGCCDVSSEGGGTPMQQYRSVATGEVTVSNAETPVLLFTVSDIVENKKNTRDCILQKIEGYADDNSLIRVYYTRDATGFSATFTDIYYGFQKVARDGEVTTVDYTKWNKLHEKRIPINQTTEIENPNPETTEFYLVSGDYILVTLEAKQNTLGGVTLVYGEEV